MSANLLTSDMQGPPAPAWQLAVAMGTVYVLWGSTYLAMRIAIETLPPFFMAASRFLIAGAILYAMARARGASRPTPRQWKAAAVVGGLLLLGGNGAVVWSEQRVPSGLAAVLVATVPLWMIAFEQAGLFGRAPRRPSAWWGPALGFAGITLLIGPAQVLGDRRPDLVGCAALIAASASWAAGSLYSRKAPLPADPFLGASMEMLCGGALLVLIGWATGEGGSLHAVSRASAAGLGYLIVFGSLIGFSAYVWLLQHTTVARASTYAFVNPVVALVLGWAAAGERLSLRSLSAATLILAAVFLMLRRGPRVS